MSDNNRNKLSEDELDSILNDAIKPNKDKASDDGMSGEPRRRRRPEGETANGEPRRRKRPDGETADGEPRRRKRPEGETADGEPHKRKRPSEGQGDANRPRKKRPRPEGSDTSRSHSGHKKSSAAASSEGAARKTKNSASSKNGKTRRRQKWTGTQKIELVAGIIFLILCLAGLTIYLILHHYHSKMNHDWSGSVTSERPVLSSMDRPDLASSNTFDVEDADEKLRKQLQENAVELMNDQDVFNVLVIGQDLRTSASVTNEQGNTDSMILVSLNRKTKTITMASFMRDIYLYLPDSGYSNRLNAAYYHGGPQYLVNTLEAYFGIKIDRYVNVTFASFIRVVDILGGLDIYVTPDELMGKEYDNYYDGQRSYGMHSCIEAQNKVMGNPPGTDIIRINRDEKGRVLHLNGNQALAYARLRSVGNNDFERTDRQRTVISKIIEKVRSASLSEINELANEVLPQVTTTITEGETFSLILDALDYANYDIQEMRIPEEGTYSGHFIKGNSVLLCNTVKNAQDLQMLIYGKTNVDEAQLREYEQQNKYIDDNGSLIDYYKKNDQQ